MLYTLNIQSEKVKITNRKLQLAAIAAAGLLMAACGKKDDVPMGEPVPMPVTQTQAAPVVPANEQQRQEILDSQAALAVVPPPVQAAGTPQNTNTQAPQENGVK